MSTVHKHFPIICHSGSSWGQGPQVVFHVFNPLWGNRRSEDGGEDLRINLRGKSQQVLVCTFLCSGDVRLALLSRLMVEMLQAAHHHLCTGTAVIMVTTDGGVIGISLQQALSGLWGLFTNYTLRMWGANHQSPFTDRWRLVGGVPVCS